MKHGCPQEVLWKESRGETPLSEGTGHIAGTLVVLEPREERGAGFRDERSACKPL